MEIETGHVQTVFFDIRGYVEISVFEISRDEYTLLYFWMYINIF